MKQHIMLQIMQNRKKMENAPPPHLSHTSTNSQSEQLEPQLAEVTFKPQIENRNIVNLQS